MKFTLSWLKQFLDTNASIDKIANTLTMIGLEVEEVYNNSSDLKGFEVAQIIRVEKHPNADRLKICTVQSKDRLLPIVCGARNVKPGIKVVFANIGVIIPNTQIKLRRSKIRGINSMGMICSQEELGIFGNFSDPNSIIELKKDAVIGNNAVKYLGADDPVFHINVTPNRSDALSVYGIARDLSAAGIGNLAKPKIQNINETFNSSISLINKCNRACQFIATRELINLTNTDSPDWLKNHLNNIGINPVSALVDIIHYVTHTFGQPIHIYDAETIYKGLTVKVSQKNARFKAVNENIYTINPGDIIAQDQKDVIHSISGIIGSKDSACSKSTKRVLLEVANFNREHIIKSGRRLGINSDSRHRFERYIDNQFILSALDIATELILATCGGKSSKLITIGKLKKVNKLVDFSSDFLKRKANIYLTTEAISKILISLGFECNIFAEKISITAPSWRHDISIKEDIVEEIIRIYGYNKLPEVPLPVVDISSTIPRDKKYSFELKRSMAMVGYVEVVTWSFMDSCKSRLFTDLKDTLMLQNPISSGLDYMRPSILPNLLSLVHNNLNRSFHNLSLFELGPIFENTDNQVVNHICAIRTGDTANKNIHHNSRKFDIFDIKADINTLLESKGSSIDNCQLKNNAPRYYHPTRSASLYLEEKLIGYFGQVHPFILEEFKIASDVIAFELNVSNLFHIKNNNRYEVKRNSVISDYQMIIRDYAFIVSNSEPVGKILNSIRNIDKKLIKSVDLFDIYSGINIPKDKKSIALSISIQDNYKTLEARDINNINQLIINCIIQDFGGSIRDN